MATGSLVSSSFLAPFFSVEFTSSGGNNPAQGNALLVGQKLSAGTATADTIVIVPSNQEDALFGRGSMLAGMVKAFKRNNPLATPYVLVLADPSGTKATGTISVTTATATVSETLQLNVCGAVVNVTVIAGQTNATIASNIATAINANLDIPVTAVYTTGSTLAVTARHNGTLFNGLRVKKLSVDSLVYTVANLSSGTGTIDLTGKESAFNAWESTYFNYIGVPYIDTTSITWCKTLMNETTGRWSALKDAYGHIISAYQDTLSNTISKALQNDKHFTPLSLASANSAINPLYELIGGAVGQSLLHLSVPPELSRPLNTLVIEGFYADDVSPIDDRNALYAYGWSPLKKNSSGQIVFDRVVTSYLTNAQNVADSTFRDINILAQLMFASRYYRNRMIASFPRGYIKASTLDEVSAVFASIMRELEALDVFKNVESTIENAIIEINALNPNRIDVRFAPSHIAPWLQTSTVTESRI